MKIIMLLDSDFPFDERVEKEAISLLEAGIDVHILCFAYNNEPNKEVYKDITIHRMKTNKKWKNRMIPLSAINSIYVNFWVRRVKKFLKLNGGDIIHAHDLIMCAVAHKIKRTHNIMFVADLHENFPNLIAGMYFMKNQIIRRIVNINRWYQKEKEWLSNSDSIIVTAPGMRDRLLAAGLSNHKYYIVENTCRSIDLPFIETKSDDDKITLFYSGGITIHRGIQVALKGYALLKKQYPNLRFWIVGSGKHEPKLKEMVSQAKIEDVIFYGWKPQKEMFGLMAKSDICLIPHLKSEHTDNTSPNKIFHYFNYKKPVLASNCNYLSNILNETKAGLTYQYDSSEDFSRKLKTIIDSSINYGLNGYHSFIEKYNWDATKIELMKAYKINS